MTKSLVLIALNNSLPARANLLEQTLSAELPNYDVQIVNCINDAEPYLASSSVAWFVFDENLQQTSLGTNAPGPRRLSQDTSRARALARDWQTRQPEQRKCMFITDLPWSSPRLSRGMLGVQRKEPESFAIDIADIINGADNGSPYIPPLIVNLDIDFSDNRDRVKCCFSTDRREYENIVHRNLVEFLESEFEISLADFFIPISNQSEPALADNLVDQPPQKSAIIKWAKKHAIKNADAVKHLQVLVNHVFMCMWDTAEAGPRPPLIHLHISSSGDDLRFPLDLLIWQGISNHIVSDFPVVWSVRNDLSRPEGSINDRNRVYQVGVLDPRNEYRFVTAYTLFETQKLASDSVTGAGEHIDRLKSILTYKNCELTLRERDEFREIVDGERVVGKKILCYLLGHGVADVNARGNDSILVGKHRVSAEDMLRMLQDRRLAFLFLNCCHLGAQHDDEDNYFGGFLTAAILGGVTDEIIAHRWAVPAETAMKLAEHFFKTTARTLTARSNALFHARRMVRSGDSADDVTWMIPIHAIHHS